MHEARLHPYLIVMSKGKIQKHTCPISLLVISKQGVGKGIT